MLRMRTRRQMRLVRQQDPLLCVAPFAARMTSDEALHVMIHRHASLRQLLCRVTEHSCCTCGTVGVALSALAEAFNCLVKASEYFTEIGRFTIAAKHFKARLLPATCVSTLFSRQRSGEHRWSDAVP